MNRIVVKSRIGSDGILQMALPVGSADAEPLRRGEFRIVHFQNDAVQK